jgi:quinol monooxygenase YgiN
MIALAVTYVIAAGREAEAEGHLRALTSATRQEPGCRSYDVFRAKDDARAFFIFERYDDEAALDAHRASPHFERHAKHGLLAVMESRSAALYVPLT